MSPATTTMGPMPVYTATQTSDSPEIQTHLCEWIPRGGEEPFPQHFGIEGWYSSSRLQRFIFCSGQPSTPSLLLIQC